MIEMKKRVMVLISINNLIGMAAIMLRSKISFGDCAMGYATANMHLL